MDLDYVKVEKILITWIKDKVKKAGAKGAVIGLSGGIDSAVTSLLSKKAFPDNTLGLIMPCNSNTQDTEDARLEAEKFNINYKIKDLSPIFENFLATMEVEKDFNRNNLAIANIKPRLRMTTLYYYASKYNYLVLGTDNWSELKIGYFTKYGDGGVDLTPLGSLVKTEVRKLADHLNISKRIINKSPSAGLWQGQTDEKEMGFSYETLDKYILTGKGDKEVKDKIESLASRNEHKLKPIPKPERKSLLAGKK